MRATIAELRSGDLLVTTHFGISTLIETGRREIDADAYARHLRCVADAIERAAAATAPLLIRGVARPWP